jgi:hypothetical protein
MKCLRIFFFVSLVTAPLFAQTQYTCHIQKVFDANSLRLYDASGVPSIDTMVLTLKNDRLSHTVKENTVQYLKQSSGVTSTRNLRQSSFMDVPYNEYKTEEALPMIIYALHGFKRVIRIDFDQVYTYDCVELKK